jgi:hypothetical protein
MASPSTVITRGFGSFGSVNLLPTLGYGQGEDEGDGGKVCGTLTVFPRVSGTVTAFGRLAGVVTVFPSVSGIVETEEC